MTAGMTTRMTITMLQFVREAFDARWLVEIDARYGDEEGVWVLARRGVDRIVLHWEDGKYDYDRSYRVHGLDQPAARRKLRNVAAAIRILTRPVAA